MKDELEDYLEYLRVWAKEDGYDDHWIEMEIADTLCLLSSREDEMIEKSREVTCG